MRAASRAAAHAVRARGVAPGRVERVGERLQRLDDRVRGAEIDERVRDVGERVAVRRRLEEARQLLARCRAPRRPTSAPGFSAARNVSHGQTPAIGTIDCDASMNSPASRSW